MDEMTDMELAQEVKKLNTRLAVAGLLHAWEDGVLSLVVKRLEHLAGK